MEIFNPNKNISIPSWITSDYFQQIVAKDEPETAEIKNFTPIAAIPPGENYTSIMLRIHMDLEMKDGSLNHKTYVMKTMLDDDKGGAFINRMTLFPKEMEMYNKYLPAFEELYSAVGWTIKLAPKCIFNEKNNGRINFVFEDLSVNNFKNVDRLKGCDMIHMKSVLRKLAELHAASAVYEEQNGSYPEHFQFGLVDPNIDVEFHRSAFNVRAESFKKAMLHWGMKDVDKYLQKFPTFDNYWKSFQSILNQSTNKFNVLGHGDFWMSNMMFSYLPTGELNETLFVDYQLCKWGSPCEDVLFGITISAAKDIRIKEFDHFINIYYERLVECLKVLGFSKPIPKLRDLHKEMFDKKSSFYAFFACCMHLPAIMLPSDKDASIHTFRRTDKVGEEFRMKAFTNPLLVEAMKDLFPFFHRRGVFNFSDFDED